MTGPAAKCGQQDLHQGLGRDWAVRVAQLLGLALAHPAWWRNTERWRAADPRRPDPAAAAERPDLVSTAVRHGRRIGPVIEPLTDLEQPDGFVNDVRATLRIPPSSPRRSKAGP